MSLKFLLHGAGLALIAAILIAFPLAAQAATATIYINPGNVPTTAAGFENQSCENVSPGEFEDGWVFVLPASAGVDGNFTSLTATFEDEDGVQHTLGATIISGSGNNKAFIITPAGWTLISASAEVEDPDEGAFFNLTHACAGEKPPDEETTPPDEETTTPGEETTTPDEETTTPDEETTTPDEETTTPDEETTTPDEETTSPGEETTSPGEATTSPDKEETTPPKVDEESSTPAAVKPTSDEDKLGKTGLSIMSFALAGIALLAAGLGTYYLSRRRKGIAGN